MDCSDHNRISSSALIKRSSTPKPSSSGTGTDENDQSYQQMGIDLLNSKKPTTKHFMSPTISASSKAVAPRKKILAEMNEISDIHIQKDPNIDNSDGALSLSGASSLNPYDPLPNYPSPRPKFLRYKPNRRSEIVLKYENEAQGSISLPSKEDEETDLVCVSQEGEEIEEEAEEENEGFLRRVLKLMLVLVVLVSSTMYISSMNSPEVPSHTLQVIEGFRGGYLKIHDHVYGAMRRLGAEDNFLKRIGFKEILKKFEVGNEFLDGNMGLIMVNQTVVIGECIGEEIVEDVYMEKVEEISINLSEVVELQVGGREIEDKKKREDCDLSEIVVELEESEDVFDHMVEHFQLKETEGRNEVESLLDNQMPTVANAFEQENEYVMEPVLEVNNLGDGVLEMVKSEMTEIENVTDNAGESVDAEIASLEVLSFEAEGELKEGLVEHIEADKIFKAVIGVTMVLAIAAPLVLAFHFKRKRDATKDSKPSINQSGVAERCNSVLPRVDSFVSPPISLINSTVEDSKDLNQSRAPSVELLGEFVVGENSSSFRSRAMKSSKLEECEVNNYSVSLDKGFDSSKAYSSVPNHASLDFSELSAINISPSYEDFTPQKKKMKKEVGRDGEANKVSITPMRRSSRIRNRAITSP